MDTYMDSPKNFKKPALIIGGSILLLSLGAFAFIHFSGNPEKGVQTNRPSGNPFAHTSEPIAAVDPDLCTDSGTPSLAWREFPKGFSMRAGTATSVSWQACGFLRSGSVKITLVSPENKETVLGSFPATTDFASITARGVLYQSGYRIRIQNDSKSAAFEAYSPEFSITRYISTGVTLPMETWKKIAFKKVPFFYPGDWSLSSYRAPVPVDLLVPPVFKSKNVLFTEGDKQAQKALEEKWRADILKRGYAVDQYGKVSGAELGYMISPPKDTIYQGDPMVQVEDHIIVGEIPKAVAQKGVYTSKAVKGIAFSVPYSASEQTWKVYDTILRSVGTTRIEAATTDGLGTTKPSIKKEAPQPDTTDALGGTTDGDALGN